MAYQKFGDKIFKEGIQVRHLNNNRQDNSKKNIAIGTAKENTADKHPDTIKKTAIAGARVVRKFTYAQAETVRLEHKSGQSYNTLANKYRVVKSTIGNLIRGETYNCEE